MNVYAMRDVLNTISEVSPQGEDQEVIFLEDVSDSFSSEFIIKEINPSEGIIRVQRVRLDQKENAIFDDYLEEM